MTTLKLMRAALVAGAVILGMTQTAKADIATITGDTTGSPQYGRPVEDLSGLSAAGSAVSYDAIAFSVDTAGEYSFLATSLGFDSFLVLYQNAFNPSAALTNALAASDDLVSLNTNGFAGPLTAGTTYVLVLSGFYNGDEGQYSVTIGGPGVITSAVPEPSAWLMLAGGLAALTYKQRRKSAA